MFTIVQRGGATREKPPEVVRGSASRLPWVWDGLCFAVPFNDSTRDATRDLVTNAPTSEWVGTPTWVRDDRGNPALLLDTSSYIGYADNPFHNKPTTSMTAYVRLRRAGAPSPPRGIFGKVYTTPAVAPYTTWGMQSTDADITKMATSITILGSNIYIENLSYVTDTTTWLSIFMRWTSGTVLTQDVLGERGQTLSTVSNGSPSSGTLWYNTTTPYPIRINALDDPAGAANNAYSQAMLWSRRLTDAEIQALVADPYGWYSPRRETIGVSSPYPLAFGGGELRHGSSLGGLR